MADLDLDLDFSYRGEGNSSIVVALQRGSKRCVLRIKKTGQQQLDSFSESFVAAHFEHLQNTVLPLVGNSFILCNAQPIDLHQSQLRKVVDALRHEQQLRLVLPPSVFPLKIAALEMPDACFLQGFHVHHHSTSLLAEGHDEDISFEIKPKLGYVHDVKSVHRKLRYCYNCVIQCSKVQSGHQQRPYRYCPLRLFSGNIPTAVGALQDLISEPHRHLIVRKGGKIVFNFKQTLTETALLDIICGQNATLKEHLLGAVISMLYAKMPSFQSSTFTLKREKITGIDTDSVLSRILSAQKLDKRGLSYVHNIYSKMVSSEHQNANALSESELSDLNKFLVQKTFADLSIMLTFRPVYHHSLEVISKEISCNREKPVGILPLPDGLDILYQISLVDVDKKKIDKIPVHWQQYQSGLQYLKDRNWLCPVKPACICEDVISDTVSYDI